VPTNSFSDISVDCVIFRFNESTTKLQVLLIERRHKTEGQPTTSLPGDVILPNEEILSASKRVLLNQTGLKIPLYRFGSFEDPERLDNSNSQRVITKAYLGFANDEVPNFGGLAANGRFVATEGVPNEMLYDHYHIFCKAFDALKKAAESHLLPLNGMAESFTTTQLQRFYEAILGKELDKRNFRRSILAKDYLEETGAYLRGTNFRPAKLFLFNQQKFEHCLEKELEKVPVILF